MTCDDFRRAYVAGDVSEAGEPHLRGCADCRRAVPQLDIVRARLADPAVWESPGADLRARVVGTVTAAARPGVAPRARSRRWWIAGAAAALVALVVAATIVARVADDGRADWEMALRATDVSPGTLVTVQGWNTGTGTRLRLEVDGLAPAGPNEYYAIWMTSATGQHVPAGTFREAGRIEAWSAVTRAEFPRIWITLEPDDGDERLTGTTVADTPGW